MKLLVGNIPRPSTLLRTSECSITQSLVDSIPRSTQSPVAPERKTFQIHSDTAPRRENAPWYFDKYYFLIFFLNNHIHGDKVSADCETPISQNTGNSRINAAEVFPFSYKNPAPGQQSGRPGCIHVNTLGSRARIQSLRLRCHF